MSEVDRYSNPNVVKVLVGNKSDIPGAISKEEGMAKADKLGYQYIESSAKSAFQVELIFDTVARKLIQKSHELGMVPIIDQGNRLNHRKSEEQPGCCY